MPQPYVSEIRIFPWDAVPSGWAPCHGQTLAPRDHPDLFAVIGTTYGGNGTTSFNLPDLQGRVPLGAGGRQAKLGSVGGEETHTLTTAEMPSHTHAAQASTARSDSSLPTGHVLSADPDWVASRATTPIDDRSIGAAGGGQAHDNMAPFLALNFCIALDGATK